MPYITHSSPDRAASKAAHIINQVTQLNYGRAFFAEPEHPGEYILVRKRKAKSIC